MSPTFRNPEGWALATPDGVPVARAQVDGVHELHEAVWPRNVLHLGHFCVFRGILYHLNDDWAGLESQWFLNLEGSNPFRGVIHQPETSEIESFYPLHVFQP